MKNNAIFAYITCFLTGVSTLIIELISFRILAPYFGTSSYVTGVIINIVLLGLALGYYIGGYCGDKFNNLKLPYFLILAVTLYLFVFYLLYPLLLNLIGRGNAVTGSIISIFSMFFLPIVCLAFIPTYLIRLLARSDNIGKTAGKIYSISTLGSIFGGILTTFILIPYLGSSVSFLISIVLLFALAAAGLIKHSFYYLILIIMLPVFFVLKPYDKKDYLYSAESEYNIIRIREIDGEKYIFLNNYFAYFSKSLNKDMISESYYDFFLLGPMIVPGKDVLMLGNGAGTGMISLSHFFDLNIDGIEIDKELTETGVKFFNLNPNKKNRIIHQDARVYLNNNTKKYDIIIVDLYNGCAYVPFHLATLEFFKLTGDALKDDGVMIVNIPNYAIDTELEEYYMNTIQKVYRSNYKIDHILLSFKKNTSWENIAGKLNEYKDHKILGAMTANSVLLLDKYDKKTKRIFTDDKAGIENLTFKILKR